VRVLLDEQLPRQLGPSLIGHEVRTVQQESWAGLKNGELLDRAEAAGFGALVAVEAAEVDAPQSGDATLGIGRTDARQHRDDLNCGLQVRRERVAVAAVLDPPRVLAVNVLPRRVGESNAPRFHRDRSCLRTSAASVSRPAVTSAWDWVKAA